MCILYTLLNDRVKIARGRALSCRALNTGAQSGVCLDSRDVNLDFVVYIYATS